MAKNQQRKEPDLCTPVVSSQMNLPQRLILIIDDDMLIRDMLREGLALQGYQPITATTVQEAEAVLQQYGADTLGLVITDLHLTADLQAKEGYVLYTHWTVRYPAIPFLLISGDPGAQALPAIQTGTVSFLAKPFSLRILLDMVRRLFRAS